MTGIRLGGRAVAGCSAPMVVPYVRDDDATPLYELLTNDLDGTNQTVLRSEADATFREPRQSPNGCLLAYTTQQQVSPFEWSLRCCNIDGSNDVEVFANVASGAAPAWSPDSSRIVFSGPSGFIATVRPDGTDLDTFTVQGATPSYNRDGTIIAYSAAPGYLSNPLPALYRVDPDGTNETHIVDSSDNASPASPRTFSWLHDADVLVYGELTSGRDYYRINADGTGKTILNSAGFGTSSNPAVTKQAIDSADTVAVGRKFATLALGWQHYLLPLDGSGEAAVSPSQYHPGNTGTLPMIFNDRIYWVEKAVGGTGPGGVYGDFVSSALDGSDVRVEATTPDTIGME